MGPTSPKAGSQPRGEPERLKPDTTQSMGWEAFFHFLWPLKTWWKKAIFIIVILFVVCFAVWSTLPERIKTEIIDYLKHSKAGQSPATVTHGKGTSEDIQNGDSNNSERMGSQVPVKQKEGSTQKPSQEGIQQHTEGAQSPAVVSGGDVNINIGGKQK